MENVYKSEDEEEEGINGDSHIQVSQYEWCAGASFYWLSKSNY